jgi:adenylate cyclase
LPGAQVIELLNAYFDCLIPPIEDHGGEVLKFLGDGLLAIFRIEGDGVDASARCTAALAAAQDALANLEAGNRSLRRDQRAVLKS